MMSSNNNISPQSNHKSIIRMSSFSTIIVILMLNVQTLIAFPSGAPPDVCSNNLLPIHGGNQPSSEPAPYVLTASSNTYSSNKPISVVIKGLSGNMFKGFVIQAQDAITGEPINSGEWSSGSAKELPCAAVTHVSPNPKARVELTWTPKGNGQVQFVATVVERFDTFYSGIKSIVRSSAGSGSGSSATSSSSSSDGITSHNRHKPNRPNNNNGHRDNSAQDNFPFESPSSLPVSQPKDDTNSDPHHQHQSSGSDGFFQSSSSFGFPPLTGSPSFNNENHQQNVFPPHPAFRPTDNFGEGDDGRFNQGFRPDERQQESSSQIFSSFQGPNNNNNNMHRFVPPQEPPHPFMRAPMHLPHHLI